ncbi:bile acid:sodium symporter family protein [Rosistilla ulvae]|nr:bile acid:sodium symporter family protein [Rosistilla ulvae]
MSNPQNLPPSDSPGPQRNPSMRHWMFPMLCGFSLIAYFWPSGGIDPFVASKSWLSWMIAATMFALGSLLPEDEVRRLRRQLPQVCLGTLTQCLVMPLAALAVVRFGGLEGGYRLGVILVGCVPGAMASNVLTLAAGGNVSYSVSLTTMATLASPITVPWLLVLMAGISESEARIEPLSMMLTLASTVLLPVIAGFSLARWSPRFKAIAEPVGPVLANLVILWIIAVVVGLNRDRLAMIPLSLLASLLIVNLVGYVGGYTAGALARMDEPMRRALTLEVGMQNAGLGTMLAVGSFGDQFPEAAIPTAAYTFGCVFTGTILVSLWRPRPGTAV